MSENNSNPSPLESIVTEEAPISQEDTQEQSENQENIEQETSPDAAKLESLENKDTSKMSKSEKKAHEKRIEKFKLKIDGRDEEMELDLNNHEEVKKHLQMSKAAQRRMQEASELRKSAEQFVDLLKKNPRKVLSDPNIGVDLKKFVQEYLDEEISNSQKTPEQLALEKAQKELEEIKERVKKDEEDRQGKEFKRLQEEQEQKIEQNIESALKEGNLPKSPYTVRKMAELMMLALENKIDLSPKDLVPLLRNQMNQDIKDLFTASNDDVLEELLGKDNITRIRKRQINKVTTPKVAQTANSVKSSGSSKPSEQKTESKQTIRDFLKA